MRRASTKEDFAAEGIRLAKHNEACEKQLAKLKGNNSAEYIQYLKVLAADSMYLKRTDAQMQVVRYYGDRGSEKEMVDALWTFVKVGGSFREFEKAEDYILSRNGEEGKRQFRLIMREHPVIQREIEGVMMTRHLNYDQALDFVRALWAPNQQLMRSRYLKLLSAYPNDASVWESFFTLIEPKSDVNKYHYLLEGWYNRSDQDQRKIIRANFNFDWKKLENKDKP